MDGRRADDPDTPLVRAVAAGSEPALAELYDRHADAVFGASYRLLGQRQQAEEVVQETFLTLWNRAERFDPIVGSLRAWLMSICRNRSIDRLRADGRRPMIVPLGAGQADELGSAEALDRSLAGGSLVGLPPSGGFLAKWLLLQPLFEQPQHWPWALGVLFGFGATQALARASGSGWSCVRMVSGERNFPFSVRSLMRRLAWKPAFNAPPRCPRRRPRAGW